MAAVWAGIGAGFALFGIIHVPEAGFDTFTDPVWEQCSSADDCWDQAQQYQFFIAYLMLGGTFALIEAARTFTGDEKLLPAHHDESDDMGFGDWFAEAGVDTRKTHWQDSVHGEHAHADADPDSTAEVEKGRKEASEDEEEAEA
jgi:hypothetical protein